MGRYHQKTRLFFFRISWPSSWGITLGLHACNEHVGAMHPLELVAALCVLLFQTMNFCIYGTYVNKLQKVNAKHTRNT